ncbi:hypothetical protein [Streptomyces bluensis]|uniref:hypothetical protein n=1 Tax=Streptomyces bluensis TaxID=33897 RepID=UPI00331B5086
MTKYETPRDGEGRRLCEHCQETPVPESLGTKPRRYCSRSCRQRAYEARKTREAIVAAVAVAVARDRRTSRDAGRSDRATTRDVAKPLAAPEVPPDPGDGWVRSIDVVDAQLRELEARRVVAPPATAQQKRRRLAAPPPTEAPTLFEPEAADGE